MKRHEDYHKTINGINYRRQGPNMGEWMIEKIPDELKGSKEEEVLVNRSAYRISWRLYEFHKALMDVNASERSLTHKIAEGLQDDFDPHYWSVDCEYNRKENESKRMAWGMNENPSLVLPDIIIHNRGTDDNLAVFEVKKDTASAKDIADDVSKLASYMKRLGYRYAFQVIVGTGPDRKNKRQPGVYKITLGKNDFDISMLEDPYL